MTKQRAKRTTSGALCSEPGCTELAGFGPWRNRCYKHALEYVRAQQRTRRRERPRTTKPRTGRGGL
jgi:hypothetical protein